MSATTRLRFELPGTWGRIDLETEATLQRSIRKVLGTVTHRRDDLADVRADLRRRIESAAGEARKGGATDFYLAFSLMPGVPLPAWISVFSPEIDSVDFAKLGLDEIHQYLEHGTRDWGDSDAVRRSATAEAGAQSIRIVRHSWRRVRDVVEGNVAQRFEFVEADYWVAATAPNRLALLTFSTALAEYEEEMLALFDAVVGTIRWPAPQTATTPSLT